MPETNSRTSVSYNPQFRSFLLSSVNVWGNKKADIDPEEYCIHCEQDVRRGHYTFCPVNEVTSTN